MNTEAIFVLLIPLLGLFPILHGGQWNWDPIGSGGFAWMHIPLIHRLLVAMFWLGWTSGLVVGVLMLLNVVPTSP